MVVSYHVGAGNQYGSSARAKSTLQSRKKEDKGSGAKDGLGSRWYVLITASALARRSVPLTKCKLDKAMELSARIMRSRSTMQVCED